jgi:hypothetical protein
MKFELTCQHYNYFGLTDRQPGTKINIQFEGESLDEILEEFAMFLRGCGFAINGTLDIVSDEEFYGTNTSTDYTLD